VTEVAGKVIADKYEVIGVLGEGGTGVVYDAKKKDDGTSVAVKVMHANLAGDKQIRGRFQREAAILKRLDGPHICPILELGEVPGDEPGASLLYIALPKLEGRSLEDVLAKESPLSVDRGLDIMLGVLAALKSAHAQGVIHRDLKPANVMLGKDDSVVVVDFGMSKIVTGGGTGTTNLTTHNMVFGTPEYMSPEQARGDELDARCDVYAAGVMLYEILTGAPPFTGSTPLNVLTAHLTSDLEPPSKRAATGRVTKALESVVLHALARDRDQRYPSAAALSAAIQHARAKPDDVDSLRPEAFATMPSGSLPFAATLPGAPLGAPTPAGAKIVLNEISAASLPPSTLPSGREPKQRTPTIPSHPPPPEPENTKTWVLLWVIVGVVSIGLGIWFALKH
jgi:serine/threonine protein kinase